ncbi:MAG: ABC transporter substrate-binding protein [Cyanobacteria bacterium P01_C01_bin.89]
MVQHDLGETQICGQPKQVVTLSLHGLDLLLSLDVQPIATTMTLNVHRGQTFDKPAQQIPYLGDRLMGQPVNLGADNTPSIETLVGLKPDLIIGERGRSGDEYETLSQIAPTILWSRGTTEQWQKSLQDLATALNLEDKAEQVIQQQEQDILALRDELRGTVATHPKLLLIGASQLDQGFFILDTGNSMGELLQTIGFELVKLPAAFQSESALVSLEMLPELDEAETIIILGWNLDTSTGLDSKSLSAEVFMEDLLGVHQTKKIRKDWHTNKISQSLTASQENRVYFATFYKWGGLSGPIGTELVLEDLRQFFLGE